MKAEPDRRESKTTVLFVGDKSPLEELFSKAEESSEYAIDHAPDLDDAEKLLGREGYRFRLVVFDPETSDAFERNSFWRTAPQKFPWAVFVLASLVLTKKTETVFGSDFRDDLGLIGG